MSPCVDRRLGLSGEGCRVGCQDRRRTRFATNARRITAGKKDSGLPRCRTVCWHQRGRSGRLMNLKVWPEYLVRRCWACRIQYLSWRWMRKPGYGICLTKYVSMTHLTSSLGAFASAAIMEPWSCRNWRSGASLKCQNRRDRSEIWPNGSTNEPLGLPKIAVRWVTVYSCHTFERCSWVGQ
jgi:hypothetical protein